jgi:hypothetical protein
MPVRHSGYRTVAASTFLGEIWQARTAPTETDCVAGHVGLELRNEIFGFDKQQKPDLRETPWRARCFSGMRWSGCGTGLQHPSNRSYVLFVDARQHRDRAWHIEAIYYPFAANDQALRRRTRGVPGDGRAEFLAKLESRSRRIEHGGARAGRRRTPPGVAAPVGSADAQAFCWRIFPSEHPHLQCSIPAIFSPISPI